MTERKGRLAGRRALITGASRGIGRAIAFRYAEEGADLLLTATGLEQLGDTLADCVSAGARVLTLAADVADRAQCEAMVQRAVEGLGGLDVLVNNAGIYKASRFVDYDPETFDRIMKVNTYGVFHMMQFALRHMAAAGGGKIVNIASTAGKWESLNQSAYNTSKHAVVGMTRCAALEHARDKVNINAICPGFVETDMIDQFDDHAEILGVSVEQLQTALVGRVPIGRMLQPVEIAHLAVYLGSAESDGMTGQTLTISGGMRMG
ncbi:MAG: SDR family NAD(P)-dependent oxidoreductase [Minwuia sp.]|uniref:SDR family NAD(P)-dependent oxidoreductase n=1 Tax=Minwuia sp. TaxID=2493630 RepID=UPI003A84D20D